ncbi:MAG TPA: hypothetical protein VHA52_07970 [Candidatus Babeliaceae bacterium]|nr:hypothetical protein [Candidatus Babeliaceae bacterium]
MNKQILFLSFSLLFSVYGITACPMHERLKAAGYDIDKHEDLGDLDLDFDESDLDLDIPEPSEHIGIEEIDMESEL